MQNLKHLKYGIHSNTLQNDQTRSQALHNYFTHAQSTGITTLLQTSRTFTSTYACMKRSTPPLNKTRWHARSKSSIPIRPGVMKALMDNRITHSDAVATHKTPHQYTQHACHTHSRSTCATGRNNVASGLDTTTPKYETTQLIIATLRATNTNSANFNHNTWHRTTYNTTRTCS